MSFQFTRDQWRLEFQLAILLGNHRALGLDVDPFRIGFRHYFFSCPLQAERMSENVLIRLHLVSCVMHMVVLFRFISVVTSCFLCPSGRHYIFEGAGGTKSRCWVHLMFTVLLLIVCFVFVTTEFSLALHRPNQSDRPSMC